MQEQHQSGNGGKHDGLGSDIDSFNSRYNAWGCYVILMRQGNVPLSPSYSHRFHIILFVVVVYVCIDICSVVHTHLSWIRYKAFTWLIRDTHLH